MTLMQAQVMKEVRWQPEDPATPALIIPMLRDEREIPETGDVNMEKSLCAAVKYCRHRICYVNGELDRVMTMAEMSECAQCFIDGYMAALTGEVRSY